MHGGRDYRGWMAATTVGVMLSLVFLVVEKHIRTAPHTPRQPTIYGLDRAELSVMGGILLTLDPSLAGTAAYPRTDQTPIARSQLESQTQVVSMLRRPPEPAASVVLQAPVASFELSELPLHANGSSGIEYLMEAIDSAFDRPMHVVSAHRPSDDTPAFPLHSDRRTMLPSPASTTGRIPEPSALLAELLDLQQLVDPNIRRIATRQNMVMSPALRDISLHEAQLINHWTVQTQSLLNLLVVEHGLEHPACIQDIEGLAFLVAQVPELANTLANHELASRLIRTGHALQRRVAVWQSIRSCLDGTTIALAPPRSPQLAREDLLAAISRAESKLAETQDKAAWIKYLQLKELRTWVTSANDIWKVGNDVSVKVLSRIHWQRLSEAQRTFLAQPEFEDLAAQLLVWGREAIDYRQLLTELEQLEDDPISRVGFSVATAVQVLRLANGEKQKLLAEQLNNHYRNANIRLCVSGDLFERFLPRGDYELRPVRQKILGADTHGDSAIQTQLSLNLIPDETGWNIDVGVAGDLVSMTRSSKGPATFHNTSTAQITSHRYVRLDPRGYQVSSEPTNVASQDYLRKMSTDFDGLPVIGDFVRLMVREQFDQKRGLAQRITRRIIAQETDAELDRRLEESLALAEKELQARIVGPLEGLHLNPMVVAMNTSEERLTIRYRVANEMQMAAHTPRPRAPSDSLISMQVHQTAINNAIAQIGLSDKLWTLPELYQRLGEVFHQSDWQLPEEVPQDIKIRFADTRPATVEMVDGKLRLTLRIAKLEQSAGRLNIERFLITTNYIPVADGLTAELIRDGVVEVNSESRDRLKLRVIFAKVFVSNPQIPLISETWAADPRSEGLAVSQLEIRDGWLAVAISEESSEQAAGVAARARELKLR